MSITPQDFPGLTEQVRRELRESMDVFMTDGRDLARKYLGEAAAQKPEVAATLAAALANQFSAVIIANALNGISQGGK
jgi:hypothetical protein